jgi:transposase
VPAWTPALVREFLDDAYGVEYSYPSCRRLLKEAGPSCQRPRRSAAEAEDSDREEFDDEAERSERRWTPQ